MVKEQNDKIINDAINNGKKPSEAGGFNFPAVLIGVKDENELKINISKIKDLVLNKKDWFSQNFVEYLQVRILIQGEKAQKDWNFGEAGHRVAKDWAGVNRLFSFNDNIYNVLNGVFSGNIKLSEFVVKNACSFSFGFSDCSIHVSFDEKKNNLEIRYTVITKEKVESCTFRFNMPKGN